MMGNVLSQGHGSVYAPNNYYRQLKYFCSMDSGYVATFSDTYVCLYRYILCCWIRCCLHEPRIIATLGLVAVLIHVLLCSLLIVPVVSFQFANDTVSVLEGTTSVSITIAKVGQSDVPTSIFFSTASGSAIGKKQIQNSFKYCHISIWHSYYSAPLRYNYV